LSYHFVERGELGWEEEVENAGQEDIKVAGWEESSDGGQEDSKQEEEDDDDQEGQEEDEEEEVGAGKDDEGVG
jgi:hypothetical protein